MGRTPCPAFRRNLFAIGFAVGLLGCVNLFGACFVVGAGLGRDLFAVGRVVGPRLRKAPLLGSFTMSRRFDA